MKQRRRTTKRILLFICVCILMCALPVFADAGSGSIHITQRNYSTKQPVEGIRLSLYQVTTTPHGYANTHEMTKAFSSFDLPVDNLGEDEVTQETVARLDEFIETNAVKPMETQTTDANGVVFFSGLKDGIYFVKQTNTAADFKKLGFTYRTASYLISLPRTTDDGTAITREVKCEPKGQLKFPEENFEKVKVTVYKVWKDSNDKYCKRPKAISVGLYENGKLHETVTLDAANNWHYQWKDLEKGSKWTVKEQMVPEGYTSKVTSEDNSFTITNTYKKKGKKPGDEEPGKNPPGGGVDTGDHTMLFGWIALLVAAALILGGRVLRRRGENQE